MSASVVMLQHAAVLEREQNENDMKRLTGTVIRYGSVIQVNVSHLYIAHTLTVTLTARHCCFCHSLQLPVFKNDLIVVLNILYSRSIQHVSLVFIFTCPHVHICNDFIDLQTHSQLMAARQLTDCIVESLNDETWWSLHKNIISGCTCGSCSLTNGDDIVSQSDHKN